MFTLFGCGDGCSEFDQEELNCTTDSQCDDGIYCNGFETCNPASRFASRYGCVGGHTCDVMVRQNPDGSVSWLCEEERIARCFEGGGGTSTCCTGLCLLDSDCDDAIFCNGFEACERGSTSANEIGCVRGPEPCAENADCDEENDVCIPPCEDADGDGVTAISCGGSDCNDSNDAIFPGATEICDPAGVDEDCDPTTIGPDEDNDGYVDIDCCNGDNCGADCEDADPTVSPSSTEVCNGLDDNCDWDIDEELRQTFYADTDGDGFGDSSETHVGCFDTIGSGYSLTPGDCDDTNPQIFPASIVCDPMPNDPNRFLLCEPDGTYSEGRCDPLTEACVTQPGGHGVCSRL